MIVLDGMPFFGELSEINPDDIGRIDILKDASSAAIYGARAAALASSSSLPRKVRPKQAYGNS